jgi:hypothetical protein
MATFTANEGLIYHEAGYETAAWWEDRQAVPGEYVIEFHINQPEYPGSCITKTWFTCEIPATIKSDYFASGFCGNRLPYDTKQNAGKPTSWVRKWNAARLLADPDVTLSEEEYDQVLGLAIADAQWSHRYAMARVVALVFKGKEDEFFFAPKNENEQQSWKTPAWVIEDRVKDCLKSHIDYSNNAEVMFDTGERQLADAAKTLHDLTLCRSHRKQYEDTIAKGNPWHYGRKATMPKSERKLES